MLSRSPRGHSCRAKSGPAATYLTAEKEPEGGQSNHTTVLR